MRRIGVDLDNTLVCYDELFHALARELQLIPAELPATKLAVRDHLRRAGAEAQWTALQGTAYGAQMRRATAFPGALAVLRAAQRQGIHVVIVSHRTIQPYAGEPYDLHRAAREWLRLAGFHDPDGAGIDPSDVFLEESQESKCRRIAALACEVFIDDLPEVFAHAAFPHEARRILFDPRRQHADHALLKRASHWHEVGRHLGLEPASDTGEAAHD